MDIGIGTYRLRTPGFRIPPYTQRPKVQRWIRQTATLVTGTATFNVTAGALSFQDRIDYNVGVVRYSSIRVLRTRCWIEGPPPVASQVAFGVTAQDNISGTIFTDRPVTGSTLAAVAFQYCLETRQQQLSTADTGILAIIGSDVVIPEDTIVLLTVDTFCEFV